MLSKFDGAAARGITTLALLLSIGLSPGLLACGGDDPKGASTDAAEATPTGPSAADLIATTPHDQAVIEIRELGTIRIDLLPELAPNTVDNFTKLANQGFYEQTTFHRVIPGFMVQGGDPNTKDHDPRNDGKGTPGYYIDDEFSKLPHERGVVSMANMGNRNTAGSQFFIVHQDTRSLDGKYTAFGRVAEGMDVVDAITELEIDKYGRYGPRNRPYPVQAVVESVRIEPAGAEHASR